MKFDFIYIEEPEVTKDQGSWKTICIILFRHIVSPILMTFVWRTREPIEPEMVDTPKPFENWKKMKEKITRLTPIIIMDRIQQKHS